MMLPPASLRRPAAVAAVAAVLVAAGPAAAAQWDPLRGSQWALATLRAPDAWKASKGRGATIAIVDTGVDLEHPDLRPRLVDGIDLVDGDRRPDDANGHGTHVAGIAAAATGNGIGIAGTAPSARIMPGIVDARAAVAEPLPAEPDAGGRTGHARPHAQDGDRGTRLPLLAGGLAAAGLALVLVGRGHPR